MPVAPPDDEPRFVTSEEVVARFPGSFPEDRVPWVQWRILDVENELMRLVPSLVTLDVESDPESSDPVVAAAARRVRSVRTLVVDKVLEMYSLAQAQGGTSVTSQMDGFSETIGFAQNRPGGRGTGVVFTEEELNRVRVRKTRSRFGTIPVGPGMFRPSSCWPPC